MLKEYYGGPFVPDDVIMTAEGSDLKYNCPKN